MYSNVTPTHIFFKNYDSIEFSYEMKNKPLKINNDVW